MNSSLIMILVVAAFVATSGCKRFQFQPGSLPAEEQTQFVPAVRPQGEDMELIFHDEFDGNSLNDSVWKSLEYGEGGIKNDTLRGPQNLEVKNGHLLLHVRKETREHKGKAAQWTAAYVYTRRPVENNVYLETRFKPTAASGVNNAFWLASVTGKQASFSNRYEVDIPETRKDVTAGDNTGRAHLAWHDWKTMDYAVNARGARDHVAQGIHVPHSWDDYHTWGLWLGENDMIYYLDGREVWRGRTHEKYHDQWRTGVGKFDKWFPNEERRAYGKFGQKDWVYSGGYAGDRMNIIFSTMPWNDEWTPLTDAADGTFMAVDYVRVFKPRRLLQREPWLMVDLARPGDHAVLTGETQKDEVGRLLMKPGASVEIPLPTTEGANPYYYSLVVRKSGTSDVRLQFDDEEGRMVFQAGVDGANALFAGFQNPARTDTAYPAKESPEAIFSNAQDCLLVVRVTPGREGEKTAVSLNAFPLPLSSENEPYFYRNIDQQGNTNANNGWQINQKGELAGKPARLVIKNHGGEILAGAFRAGPSFLSVLPQAPSAK